MPAYDYTSETENALFEQFFRNRNQQDIYANAATPEMAFLIDDLVRAAPNATADLVVPAAEAVLAGEMVQQQAADTLIGGVKAAIETAPPPDEEEGNWWNRGWNRFMSGVRTGSRWTFATAEFVPQAAQNIGARIYGKFVDDNDVYKGSDNSFFDGFVASTDLGTMLTGVEAGDGFFIGEAAAEQQRQKALEYRGTIGEEGWTFGRGTALSVSQPGSRTYSILSGLVDAAAAIVTPSLPGVKAVKGGAAVGADLLKLRATSGLTNFAEAAIDPKKVGRWLEGRSGTAITRKISEVADIEEAMELFPKADANFWEDVVNTKDFNEARSLLRRDLGLERGLQSVEDLNVSRMSGVNRAALRKSRAYSRLKAPVPGREMVLGTDDIRDVTRTMKNARDYMRTAGVSYEDRVRVLKGMSEALTPLGEAPKAKEALKLLDNAIIDALARKRKSPLARSMDEEFTRTVFQRYRDEVADFDLHGETSSAAGDAIQQTDLRISVDGQLEKVSGKMIEPTAGLSTEGKRWGYFMPDPRRVRRVSSQYSWVFAKTQEGKHVWGDPRALTSMLDWIQNQVWRPATLLTGGYIFRNITESIVRQTMTPGIKAGPTHPLEWVQSMFYRKFKGDVNGEEWVDSASDMLRRHQREYAEATGNTMREAFDPMRLEEAALGRGYYALSRKRVADPARSSNQYIRGVANELRLLAGDDLARVIASHYVQPAYVKEWLMTTAEGQRYLRGAQARWANKRMLSEAGEEFTGSVRFIDDTDPNNIKFDDDMNHNIDRLIEIVSKRVESKTGGIEQLKEVVANSGPLADPAFRGLGEFGEHTTADGRQIYAWRRVEMSRENWRNYEYDPEFLDEIRAMLADPQLADKLPNTVKFIDSTSNIAGAGGRTVDSWWRRTTDHFFGSVYGKKEAFLNRSPVFRQYYYRRVEQLMGNISREGAETMIENIRRAYRAVPEENLRNMRKLKANKAGKYEWNGKELSKTEYNKRVKQLEKQIARRDPADFDKWAANYVGSKKLWNQINEAKVSGRIDKADDVLTGEKVDILAKAFALEETKRVFYNASDKSNFADILRIIVPFGPAWGEAMRMWRKQVLRNPNRIKNLGVSVQGFRDMDPDGDGSGFITKDPVSGEMVFNYPFSADMLPLIGGVAGGLLGQTFAGRTAGGPASFVGGAVIGGALGAGAREVVEERLGDAQIQLRAPVRSLSMAFNVIPGMGPVVQLSAAQALENRPEADDILKIISPFGSPDSAWEFAPSWARKIQQAITANPESDRMYLDLFMDAYKVMYATGEYDTNDSDSLQLLRQRAEEVARTLLVFRGLAQFTGPARPAVGFEVPVEYSGIELTDKELEAFAREGYVPNNILANAFREMQEEDYQNAVYNFISTFGTDTLLYVKGRTETVGEGLDASAIFGAWERRNADLAERYPDIFGYFAPVGSEFDLQTYLRQIATGKRRRITDPMELQRDAEAVVGKALYRRAVREFPQNPNEVDQAQLREYRRQLENELPGFKYEIIELGEREILISQVIDAARTASELTENPVAEAIRAYSVYRDNAIQEAITRAGEYTDGLLTRKANADLRQYLRNVGEKIINRIPEFERVWSRLLFDEVDVDE